jgi:hypothetical protein
MRFRTWVSSLAVVVLAAAGASAGEPRGPAFGNNRYATSIVRVGKAADGDDYVAALIEGETLSVEVASAAKSALLPTLTLVAPDGAETDPHAVAKRGGRVVSLRKFVVPVSGTWTVRVGAAGATEGAYTVRFHVAPSPTLRLAKERLGGDEPSGSEHAFQAVDGSTLSLTIESSGPGAPVAIRSLTGPDGRGVPIPADAVLVKGGRVTARGVALANGPGEYRLGVGIGTGTARCSIELRVDPPPRPRGRATLAADEPFLGARASPMEITAGSIVRLNGSHFATTVPRPRVWFGDAEAILVGVGPLGTTLDAVAPPAADGSVVAVTVQNPDGQAAMREALCRYVPPVVLDVKRIEPAKAVLPQGAARTFTVSLTRPAPPLGAIVTISVTGGVGSAPPSVVVPGNETQASFRLVAAESQTTGRVVASYASDVAADVAVAAPAALQSISPAEVTVLEGATSRFTLALDAPAPPAGLDVELTASPGLGTVPGWVHVEGGAASAEFDFRAGNVRASGTITAASENSVAASVVVLPPTTIDVSGWRIEQANSARTFTIPSGTVLHEGDYLVVGRSATRTQFEAFWGRTLGANVVYLDGGDQWPNVNGSETYLLKDADGTAVDGPTVAMTSGGGDDFQRRPGLAASDAGSWVTASASPVSNATPGSGQAAAPSPVGVYVSEFSDANGSGNFVYEFVELHFDRLP